ncbi:MAG: hypothetical protein JXJ18_00970 [Rhodobacteraceae bacterium]|nr:hypothetical protein [Paracoccaceae bacterium]
MSIIDDLIDALARDAIEAAENLKDDQIITDVSKAIGATSPTSQEAFMTAVRIRLALNRGRKQLEQRLAQIAAAAPPSGQ